jgi:hypothetical protein
MLTDPKAKAAINLAVENHREIPCLDALKSPTPDHYAMLALR